MSKKNQPTSAPVPTPVPTDAPAVQEQVAEPKQEGRGFTSPIIQMDEAPLQGADAAKNAEPAPTAAPTAAPQASTISELVGRIPQPTDFEKALVAAEASELTEVRQAAQVLTEYVSAMRPDRLVTMADIARYQGSMFRALRAILVSEQGFNPGIRLVMAFFRRYREEALRDPIVMRGLEDIEHLRLSATNRLALRNLLSLLTLAAGLENVKLAARNIDLGRCFDPLGLTPAQLKRAVSFFS